MRQEYLSNDRIEPDEPKLHKHRCVQCGILYDDWNEDNCICDVCRDEKVYTEQEVEEYLGFSLTAEE